MKLMIVGSGYVGLVAGACLSELGHDVVCVDRDAGKIDRLRAGIVPIFEPGLDELMRANTAAGRLTFANDLSGLAWPESPFRCLRWPSRAPSHASSVSLLQPAATGLASEQRTKSSDADAGRQIPQMPRSPCLGWLPAAIIGAS